MSFPNSSKARKWIFDAIIERCRLARESGDDQYITKHPTTYRILKEKFKRKY